MSEAEAAAAFAELAPAASLSRWWRRWCGAGGVAPVAWRRWRGAGGAAPVAWRWRWHSGLSIDALRQVSVGTVGDVFKESAAAGARLIVHAQGADLDVRRRWTEVVDTGAIGIGGGVMARAKAEQRLIAF
eukprot:gene4500-19960_t